MNKVILISIDGMRPDGALACGTTGKGRLVNEESIVQEILASLAQ